MLFSVEIGELQFFRFLPEFSELLDSCISIGCFLNGQQVSDDVAWVGDLFSRSFVIFMSISPDWSLLYSCP